MKQSASVTSKLFHRSISLSGSLHATTTFLRRQLWAWPVIAAAVIGGIGWWIHSSVEAAIRKQMADALSTTLNADVAALNLWIKQQQNSAALLASTESILPIARDLTALAGEDAHPEHSLLQSKPLAELRDSLAPRLKSLGYTDFLLVSPTGIVLAAEQDAAIGKPLDGYREEFFRQVLLGKAAVSKPFRSPLLMADDKGQMRAGLPIMLAAAPILDEAGKPVAALGVGIRPEEGFTQILQIARPGESGETYAFDRNGLLLSQSRFDDDLKSIGLLVDQPEVRSILTVEVRDPEVNMVEGTRPAMKRAEQPLTRMANSAVAGESGVDVIGYRDYRGVPVIGAWTWLPEHDFGVTTEQDVAEAFQALYVLQVAFWILMGMLGVGAVVIFVFMVIVARQQLAVQRAVLEAKQLGQYTLEEKIGSGGMGSVYRARHAMLRRPTAVKLLEPEKVSDVAITRFEREVQLTSQLAHPNTVAIYDYGRTPEGVFYYAMEYLDGINLEDLVQRFGPLPEARAIAVLRQICGSLAEAHELGLIHRDIKPANILISHRGGVPDLVKVLDFGLAKSVGIEGEANVTGSKSLTGTPLYLAPEAIERPESADARTDLYAVGGVAYYLLTATPVFEGNTIVELCMQHVKAAPESPSKRLARPIESRLEALVLAMLAKAKEDRPASARAILEELALCSPPSPWTAAQAETWWRQFKAGMHSQSPRRAADTGAGGQTVVYTATDD